MFSIWKGTIFKYLNLQSIEFEITYFIQKSFILNISNLKLINYENFNLKLPILNIFNLKTFNY